ncbi:MAG: FAD-dependent oxidoreductase [Spirochaetota bacterium]
MSRYLIVGGVAGGASAAARLRRLDERAEITVYERGGFMSYANCGLPYHIGGVIRERNALFVQNASAFKKRFNVDVFVGHEVIEIDRVKKSMSVRDIASEKMIADTYDKLILSPGAAPIRPPIPGIDAKGIFTLRNVADTDAIVAYAAEKKISRALVVGAGFIGVEMAENLHARGASIAIVEMLDQVLPPFDRDMAVLVHEHIRAKGVALHLGVSVTSFRGDASGVTAVLSDGKELTADMVILSIGVAPDTAIAKAAGLDCGERNAILVNEYLQTSDASIYAVGDAIAFCHPIFGKAMPTYLAGPANKQARIAADNIVLGNKKKYPGSIGTAVVKVFDSTAALTGASEKMLVKEKIPCRSWIVHPASHASYYPAAAPMSLKIVFSPEGKILGAQAVGGDGVDKRIDVIAAYMKMGGSVRDLAEFEQAYAPPYSSAKDPVNFAGFVAENIIDGVMKDMSYDELRALPKDAYVLVDVRTSAECARGMLDGAVNIPVDDMRSRIGDVPKGKKIVTYCAVGLRSYIAARILMQNGFDAYDLKGGYRTCDALRRG